jgi:hypothetical protein
VTVMNHISRALSFASPMMFHFPMLRSVFSSENQVRLKLDTIVCAGVIGLAQAQSVLSGLGCRDTRMPGSWPLVSALSFNGH